MKGGRVHSVPLSDRAAAIVEEAARGKAPGALIFPDRLGKPFDDSALRAILRRMGV